MKTLDEIFGWNRKPKVIPEYDKNTKFDWGKAKFYQKKAILRPDQVRVANKDEEVITKHGSHEEVRKIAKSGDHIVTRSPGDSYVVTPEEFKAQFEPHPNKPGHWSSKSKGWALPIDHDFIYHASFGRQHIKKGGYLFKSAITGKIHGNQKDTFENDFDEVIDPIKALRSKLSKPYY